jgi:hypothetical protein
MQVSLSTSAKPVFLCSSNLPLPQEFELYSSENSVQKRILKGKETSSSSLEFTGENGQKDVSCKYILGITDKKSQKVIIKELEIYKISGKLKFPVQSSKRKIDRESLGSEFGSKKKKKEINSKNLNSIKNISQDSFKEISENLKSLNNTATVSSDFLLLKPNLETVVISQVYSLNGILPENFLKDLDLGKLERLAREIIQNSQYLKDKIEECKSDGQKMRLAIYIQILKNFYKRKDRELAHILPGTNEEIMEFLLNKFTEYTQSQGGKYRFTPTLKDLVLAEIGVLALHLDNFSVNIQKLIHDLGISTGTMVKIYKELGVRINTVKKEKIAVLTLPLASTPRSSLRSSPN